MQKSFPKIGKVVKWLPPDHAHEMRPPSGTGLLHWDKGAAVREEIYVIIWATILTCVEQNCYHGVGLAYWKDGMM